MSDVPEINQLPPAPLVTDSEPVFASKASAFVNSLAQFRTELNELGSTVQDAVASNLVNFDGFAGVWSAGTFNAGQVVFHTPSNAFYIALEDGETAEPPGGDWGAIGQSVLTATVIGSDGTSDWTGSDPSVATITVSGILSTDVPIVDLDLSNVAFADVEDVQAEWALVYRVEASADNELKLYAIEEPAQDFALTIKVVR